MNKQTRIGKNIVPLVNMLASKDNKVRRKARNPVLFLKVGRQLLLIYLQDL